MSIVEAATTAVNWWSMPMRGTMEMLIWIVLPVGLLIVVGLIVAVVFYFSGGRGGDDQ